MNHMLIVVQKSARHHYLKLDIVSFVMITRRCVIYLPFYKTMVRYDREGFSRIGASWLGCVSDIGLNSTGAPLVESRRPRQNVSRPSLRQ
jgi:hypothetical protein